MTEDLESAASTGAAREFDPARTFVRVTGRTPGGFVEFDFAIGDPDVFVELVLSPDAFDEFCARNAPEVLAHDGSTAAEDDAWAWRLADARSAPLR